MPQARHVAADTARALCAAPAAIATTPTNSVRAAVAARASTELIRPKFNPAPTLLLHVQTGQRHLVFAKQARFNDPAAFAFPLEGDAV